MLEGTPDDPFSGSDYWQTHVMAIAVQKENWAAETVLGYENFGHRLVDLLKVRVDSDPESEQYKEAYKLVWRLLTGSSMQKISRGKDLVHSTSPGVLWDENPHWLSMPGTFGELLRYGAAHFRQKREDIALMEPKRSKVTLKKGLLEP